ncbi:MAG: ABC transporter permease [Lachnospiraceae bacterium]|nr:ABC transporter permease [Lachnospiraceae bacterium]
MKTMLKTNIKLLLRTKAFWFFLVLTPLLSTLVLKLKFDSSAAYMKRAEGQIRELGAADDKVAYNGGQGEYLVKVYDASNSTVSEGIMRSLAGSGMYIICRVDMSGQGDVFTQEFVDRRMKADGFEDRMGAAVYIYPGISEASTASGIAENIRIYALSADERTDLLKSDLEFMAEGAAALGESFAEAVNATYKDKSVVSISAQESSSLTADQVNHKTQIGYAFAFMTLGFVFCGIFVAHSAIEEQKNGVFTRIGLTKAGPFRYFASKLLTSAIISVMSTGVMALCSLAMSEDDLGMSRVKYLALIFFLGMIFSSMSMLLGIIIGDVMGANVAAFSLWCLSALFSGLYFPLNDVSPFIKLLSSIMPQKWFLRSAEMILTGDNFAFVMVLLITAVYLLVVVSLGSLGIRLRRVSEWGNS